MLPVCISTPHRHTGNSLKPGTRKRSNADMIPHRVGKSTRIRPALLCSSRLFKIAHLDRSYETPTKQNGRNYIADCAFDEITDPVALEARLAAIGCRRELFVSLASEFGPLTGQRWGQSRGEGEPKQHDIHSSVSASFANGSW